MNDITTTLTREALINDVDLLKRNALQVAQDMKMHANAHVDETKKRVTDLVESVRGNVVSHPFTLLGIGLAVGFLFGLRARR